MERLRAPYRTLHRSLRFKILAGLIPILAISVGLFVYLEYLDDREHMMDELNRSATQMGQVIQGSLRHSMLEKDFQAIQIMVDDIAASEEEIADVLLVNKEGEIRFSPQGKSTGVSLGLDDPRCQICHRLEPENRRLNELLTTEAGEKVLRSVNPIPNETECYACHDPQDEMNGILVIDLSTARMDAQLATDLRRHLFLFPGALAVLVLTINFAGRRMVVSKLERIVKATRLFGKGALEQRVAIESQDEIGELAHSFNEMAEQIQAQTETLSALHAIASTVTQSLDLDEILQDALDMTIELLGLDAGDIRLLDPTGQFLSQIRARSNVPPAFADIHRTVGLGECLCGMAAQTGEPVFSTDLADEPRAPTPACLGEGFQSSFSIPLPTKEGIAGVLHLASLEKRTLEARERETLIGIGNQIGVAIENAGLYEATKQELAERKRAEKALRESEERFRQFFENEPEYCYMISPEGVILDVNSAALKALGYKKEELVGKPLKTIYAPESLPRAKELFAKWKESGALKDEEMVIITREGNRRTVLLSAGVMKDGDGKILHSVSVQKDITERKRAEEALRKSEETFNRMVTSVEDVLYSVDGETREFRYVSPAFERLLGYTLEDVRQMGGRQAFLSQVIERGKFAEQEDTFEQLLSGKTEETPSWEGWWRCKDGSLICLEDRWSPIYDGERLLSTDGVLRDITARKRAEEQAQKRLREITALHKVSEIINATLDLKEVFQRVVEELSDTFGYRSVDIYLLEEDGLRLQANVGYDAETTIELIPLERGVIGRVARTGQPAFIRDVSQDLYYLPSYPDITSEIAVPIKSGKTLLGVLNVECDECRLLTEDDLLLLHTLSSHIGVAIENARLYQETQRLAITDGLTGLYNLRYSYQALEKEIQRSERYHHSVSLIILDIDNFKRYNDLYGHLAGDDLLIELSQLMSKVTRQTDTLARYGGEEFVIILPETEIEGARFLAERLQEEVREHRFSMQDGQTIGRITISLGIATYPHHADSGKALVDAADKALLRAKRAGKNRLFAFGEELIEGEEA